jgi:single-stranded DNA-binding protein
VIAGLVAGRLAAAPSSRVAKNGNNFATCRLRVSVGDEPQTVNCIAFSGKAVQALLALAEGDAVAVSGELEITRTWVDRDGKHRPSIDMKVFNVLTEYHARRKRAAMAESTTAPSRQQATATDGDPDDSAQLDQLQF